MEKKILVVEDDADTRGLIAAILKMEGYTVYTADDGSEGLKLVQLDRPDLIITDLDMPNLDGVAMIQALRTQPESSALPIIAMTAYEASYAAAAMNAGADRAFRKPLDYDSLLQTIGKLIS